jgi:guanosine-3',5'-bis(diphosphate) 3'-pyrophosphohydrolase
MSDEESQGAGKSTGSGISEGGSQTAASLGPTTQELISPAVEIHDPKPDVTGTTDEIAERAWNTLRASFLTYLDSPSEKKIRKAFEFAHALHVDQRRKSGEPYIVHPLSVAEILCEYRMDETSLVAAILHDVVEDTHVSVEQVVDAFGNSVGSIVDGLTKLAKVEFRSTQEKLAENFRKMVIAMSRDIRVIIVKLADRTHNMRTIKALSLEKRQRIAEETIEIYAPLAGRLGMYKIKAELEDLCLKVLKPEVYFNLVTRVAQKKSAREGIIGNAITCLQEKLDAAHIKARVEGRAKHFYSIYKKMTDKRMEFEDIYDLFAVRILVGSVSECYEVLGTVHSQYRPVPGRFKDYIAMPKANLYQSLHTTVVAARGELLEVQIRTWEMHSLAENGIAAHWVYKERRGGAGGRQTGGGKEDDTLSQEDLEKFNWLKQIVKHQKELQDPSEFLEAVKVDLFEDEVYCFSPKGDVFELQRGSTCLDFAFAVHTELGLKTAGAKVNGRMVPLRTKLFSGDVVEIISSNKVRANKDWLSFVTSSKARNKIRAVLRTEERDEGKRMGLDMLEQALERLGTTYEKVQKAGQFQEVHRLVQVGGLDDALMQIGYGKLDALTFAQKVTGLQLPEAKSSDATSPLSQARTQGRNVLGRRTRTTKTRCVRSTEDSVKVQGLEGIVVRLAKCCEPLPGQPIVGYVSRGRGVTVHQTSCAWAIANDPARRVECSWNSQMAGEHHARLRITTHDKQGMLANITKLISSAQINITGAEVQTTPERRGVITIRVHVADIHQLRDVHQKLEALDGVIHVERLTG